MAGMDHEGDTVMGDYPPEPSTPQLQIQPPLADFTLTFGKFKGRRLCDAPMWYLNWLTDGITDPSPTFTAALTYALAASSFSEMEIDWYPPALSAAPDKFHQWRKLNDGKLKSTDTALWITTNDTKEYFYLGDEILQVMKVPKFPNDEPPQTNATNNISPRKTLNNVARYGLYHIWDLAQVYITKGEADAALRRFMNERPRGMGGGSPRKI
jgi:hypothetical protein